MSKINTLKEALNSKFNMKDLGAIKTLLGMEIHCLKDGSIFINQPNYIRKLLKRHKMEGCKTISTPMALKIVPSDDDFDIKLYQSLMGELMWPSLGTRPDIAFTAGYLARWNAKPTSAHFTAQKRLLRYLKGTIDHGILFKSSTSSKLEGFSDADWAGDTTDRKSTSGNVYTLYGGAIVWAATKQKTVANSSVESEYVALASAVKEGLWLLAWIREMGFNIPNIV